ncbi:TPA: hypothetical protein VMX41_001794 [Streptococcus pyogenes]|nr:hypothetical protein [Streptococcus pyogenes]
MAKLFPEIAQKADAMSDRERAYRANVAAAHQEAAKHSSPPMAPAFYSGLHHVTDGAGLAALEAFSKRTVASKADNAPALHPSVAPLARAMAPKQVQCLSMIVEAHERSKGDAIEFTAEELGRALQTSTKGAAEIVAGLQRSQLIASRSNSMGGHAGYVPTLPRV